MIKYIILLLWILFLPQSVIAFGSGAGTCDVVHNFATITGMQSRTRNQNTGGYSVTSNLPNYTSGQPVELTITGPQFTGIMFTVVDDSGNRVGTFDSNTNLIHDCQATVAITHTGQFGSMTSYTLFWIPPSTDVGTVYVLGYVLSGTRGNQASQEFYRFVRDDNSAISLDFGGNSDLIFSNGFE